MRQPGFDVAAEIGRQTAGQSGALTGRFGDGRLGRVGLGFGGRRGWAATAAGTAEGYDPRAMKARRFVRFFRPLALCIVRLEYAPREGALI